MKFRRPNFELLREQRELAVVNPANGVRFTISINDWQGVFWAVRVYPHDRRHAGWNPYTPAHRLMPRERIPRTVCALCAPEPSSGPLTPSLSPSEGADRVP